MSYAYDSLERALELAVARVPVKEIGALIAQVEYVVSTNADARALEDELLVKAGIHSLKQKAFRIERLQQRTGTERVAA